MTDPILRLPPSGPPIKNAGGGGFAPGSGARLRLAETTSPMSGSLAVPASPDVICPDGFGSTDAIVLTLAAPKQALKYRARLALDVLNTTTNVSAEVILYLDVSIDGGTTYTNRAKVDHVVGVTPQDTAGHTAIGTNARGVEIRMPMLTGAQLGINDNTPPANIKLRARANSQVGSVLVSSLASSGGTPVTGLNGTIAMELEECY